jgi:hypothetical protein
MTSKITTHADGGVTFEGIDATRLYQAITLAAALKLYDRCGMIPTRGMTITKMLALASTFSGKAYKRGAALQAAADVTTWADAMKAALPVERRA